MKTAPSFHPPVAPQQIPGPLTRPYGILLECRRRLARQLLVLADFLETHAWIPLLALTLLYTLAVLYESLIRPIWHDEIFTFHIADAPTLAQSFRQLRSIDLNPPLLYLLTRLSFHLFGVNTFACRLPDMIAFLLAMLFLFLFIRRRAGVLFGCLAAAFLFASPAGDLATEARPYALMLCFVCLALVAWQKARDRAPSALPLLLLAGFGMLLTHIFALLPWGVFAAVEFLRLVQRRGTPRYLFAWSLCLVSALVYRPMLQNHAAAIFPPDFQPNISTLYSFYWGLLGAMVAVLFFTRLTLLLLTGNKSEECATGYRFTPSEWFTVAGLALAPIPLLLDLIHAHAAFFPRYGVMGAVGMAAAGSGLLAIAFNHRLPAALLALIFTFGISPHTRSAAHELLHRRLISSQEPTIYPCQPCIETAKLDSSLPLVVASGLTFIEMNQHESPSTLSRLYFLSDPRAAAQYAHADIFNAEATIVSSFGMKGKVEPYATFLAQHPRFFVFGTYAYPEDWLLRKLMADGATLRLIDHPGGAYINHELYEVTISQ